MDTLGGIGGLLGELGGGATALFTGQSPASKRARAFLGKIVAHVDETPALKAEFLELLEAVKDTDDEIWRDVKLADRLAMMGPLRILEMVAKK